MRLANCKSQLSRKSHLHLSINTNNHWTYQLIQTENCFIFFKFSLQGFIQDTYIVSGPNGYLKQCPNLEPQCPTCGQYSLQNKRIDELEKRIEQLTQRVSANSLCPSFYNIQIITLHINIYHVWPFDLDFIVSTPPSYSITVVGKYLLFWKARVDPK